MPHPLKTILWKELRENWKWAALGSLCLAFVELYALYQPAGYNELPINSQMFTLVTICGSVLIGAALGALQILPELSRDRWAALLHRPVPRSTVFLGKIIAGIGLYLIAVGIPLLLCILCSALPGQFASPFVPALIPPVIGNAFLGVAFYAAAVLVCLTRGHWYRQRALIVLSVLPLLIIVPSSPWMFLPTVFASALLLAAARGTMAANGGVQRGWHGATFSLGLLLWTGLGVVFVFLFLLLNFIPGANDRPAPGFEYGNPTITADGKVFLSVYRPGANSPILCELDGTPVTDEKYVGDEGNAGPLSMMALCYNLRSARDYLTEGRTDDPHTAFNYVQMIYGENGGGTEYWYYLFGKDYLVGYDKLTHRRIGICDRDGFHPPDQAPHPFPKPLQLPVINYFFPRLGWIDGQLYALDFPDRNLRPFFTAPSGSVHSAIGLLTGVTVSYIAVALDDGIQILGVDGRQVVTIPYHAGVASRSQISLATLPTVDRIFIQYDPYENFVSMARRPSSPTVIDEVDLQGNLLHSYSIAVPNHKRLAGWAKNFALVSTPLVPTAIAAVIDTFSTKNNPEASSHLSDSSDATSYSWRTLILVGAGLGVFAAAITFLSARAAGFSQHETIGWVIFAFSLGLLGLIAFRLTAPFPTRVSCPYCSRKRALRSEQCPACHQGWPTPASNGTEIFAESEC